MTYTCFHFNVNPVQPGSDVLIALLGEMEFESFVQTEEGFDAFIQDQFLGTLQLDKLDIHDIHFSYTVEKMEDKNWNEEWESNFNPVYVEDWCCIRAPFHPLEREVKKDIIIQPQMSFGTGHHETTWLMCSAISALNLHGKRVLDMGCGTGVLAILMEKCGAAYIDAIDIDSWSVENAKENAAHNHCQNIHIQQGDSQLLAPKHYDVIVANINRNVLLKDMVVYAQSLKPSGILLLSGFFESDIPSLKDEAEQQSMSFIHQVVKNDWILLKFVLT